MPSPSSPKTNKASRRWLKLAFIALPVSAALSFVLSWWQRQPLVEAEASEKAGRFDYAIALSDYYLEDHPDDGQALMLKARALTGVGRPAEAIALFERVGAAEMADIHAWARAHLLLRHWSRAIPLLVRALQLEPNNADALHEITACRVRVGAYNDALVSAQQLATSPGHEAQGHLFVGSIQGDSGNHREAADAFAKVLEFEPNALNLQVSPDEFLMQYGRMLLKMGRPKEAIEVLRKSVAVRETGEAFSLLGTAASEIGDIDKAALAWKKAVQVEPANREAREALANIALQKNDPKAALDWLAPLEKAPEQRASSAYLFQRAYQGVGDTESSAGWREQAAKLRKKQELESAIQTSLVESPNSFWSKIVRAHRFASEGNWDEADVLASGLIKEAPGETFVIELVDAIQQQKDLPSLDKLPITRY